MYKYIICERFNIYFSQIDTRKRKFLKVLKGVKSYSFSFLNILPEFAYKTITVKNQKTS